MTDFARIIAVLSGEYGTPARPPARGPFELVLWENACYLLPDERRAEVFAGLRERAGLTPRAILEADRAALLELAARGGMRPEARVSRWLEIARITLDQFDGELAQILERPYAQAKKALKQFPSIGDPGAEKILMLCGVANGLPLDSNGLRVLVRIGYGREHKRNYSSMYRSVQEDLAPHLPRTAPALTQAHLLLRRHGQEICHNTDPLCHSCGLSKVCAYAGKHLKSAC